MAESLPVTAGLSQVAKLLAASDPTVAELLLGLGEMQLARPPYERGARVFQGRPIRIG